MERYLVIFVKKMSNFNPLDGTYYAGSIKYGNYTLKQEYKNAVNQVAKIFLNKKI